MSGAHAHALDPETDQVSGELRIVGVIY